MKIIGTLIEIISIIKKNKARSIFAGCAVAWGIFLLIVLLGVGRILESFVKSDFSDKANNSISVWTGYTSIPYKGFSLNRKINFTDKDYQLLKNNISGVEHISMSCSKNVVLSHDDKHKSCLLEGVSPEFIKINKLKIETDGGRFINYIDIMRNRKIIVINNNVKKILYNDINPIGKHLEIGNLLYEVVGVYENEYDNTPTIYAPFTTVQLIYNQGAGFSRLDFTVEGINTIEENDLFTRHFRNQMSSLHNYSRNDQSAIRIWNTIEEVHEANEIFNTIGLFIWIIGICSLISGVVGVSNIMIISVQERTREIGIRKAIGASPNSILILIIIESILITSISGFLGLILGVGFLKFGCWVTSIYTDNLNLFLNPTTDFISLAKAILVIVISGTLAGLIPAMRATHISPIEAIRSE